MTATVGGCWLLWKGFAGGGELVMTLNTAISGLIGFLGGRNTAAPTTTNINQTKPEGDPVAVVTPIP